MSEDHELRPPLSEEGWRAFHNITRKVLFDNRGELDLYNENHPDDSKLGNHPLVLRYRGNYRQRSPTWDESVP